MPGKMPRLADGRPKLTMPDLRMAYEALFTTR
jgi:hypothetical protein